MLLKIKGKKKKTWILVQAFSYGIDYPIMDVLLVRATETIKAPIGFEPMNQGFADPYNRPLCQGAIAVGKCILLNRYLKSRNFCYTPPKIGNLTRAF